MECYNTSITAVGSLIKIVWAEGCGCYVCLCENVVESVSLSPELSLSLAVWVFFRSFEFWLTFCAWDVHGANSAVLQSLYCDNESRALILDSCQGCQKNSCNSCFCFPSHGFPFHTSNLAIIANLQRSIISGESNLNGCGSAGAWLNVNGNLELFEPITGAVNAMWHQPGIDIMATID